MASIAPYRQECRIQRFREPEEINRVEMSAALLIAWWETYCVLSNLNPADHPSRLVIQQILEEEGPTAAVLDLQEGSPSSPGNVGGFVSPPPLPLQGPSAPFTQGHGVPLSYNIPPGGESTAASPGQVKHLNTNILQLANALVVLSSTAEDGEIEVRISLANALVVLSSTAEDGEIEVRISPKPSPRPKISSGENEAPSYMDLPELPAVPDDSLHPPGGVHTDDADEIDFDDLTRRFEDLKKKK
uniref:Uncharacterized protein n=1 Tax=Timema cristinae TaxID=61476 RepID=A0A7R9D9S1_TIMCR|nr:unnamed protein product [Timema cristinae]